MPPPARLGPYEILACPYGAIGLNVPQSLLQCREVARDFFVECMLSVAQHELAIHRDIADCGALERKNDVTRKRMLAGASERWIV